MKESYKDQVKALQRAAGIRKEELSGYKAGVEMLDEESDIYEDSIDAGAPIEEIHGVEKLDSAINNLKSAQDSMNALISDQKFNGKHKQKLQMLAQKINAVQSVLSNLASGGVKKKTKTLEP